MIKVIEVEENNLVKNNGKTYRILQLGETINITDRTWSKDWDFPKLIDLPYTKCGGGEKVTANDCSFYYRQVKII